MNIEKRLKKISLQNIEKIPLWEKIRILKKEFKKKR